jgi:hypothetical protein
VESIALNGGSKPLRERSAEILPLLIARREREASSASLLRPCQANSTDHLLRPIYSAAPDTTNLLRTSDREEPVVETAP